MCTLYLDFLGKKTVISIIGMFLKNILLVNSKILMVETDINFSNRKWEINYVNRKS